MFLRLFWQHRLCKKCFANPVSMFVSNSNAIINEESIYDKNDLGSACPS